MIKAKTMRQLTLTGNKNIFMLIERMMDAARKKETSCTYDSETIELTSLEMEMLRDKGFNITHDYLTYYKISWEE